MNPPQRDGSDRPALVRTVLGWTKALFTPVAFAFLAYFAWQGRDVLVTVVGEASLPLLGLAAIVWSLLHLLSPMLAVFVLGACGSDVTWWRAFSIMPHVCRRDTRRAGSGIRWVESWTTTGEACSRVIWLPSCCSRMDWPPL